MTLGRVIRSFASPDTIPLGLGWNGKYLIYCDGAGTDRVYLLDPMTGRVLHQFTFATLTVGQPGFDGRACWISSSADDILYYTDLLTGRTIRTLPGPVPAGGTRGIAPIGGGLMWVMDSLAGTVSLMDCVTGQVIKSVNLPASPGISLDCTWDGRHLWMIGYSPDKALEFDPVTGREVRTFIPPAPQCSGIAFDGRFLWVCSFSTAQIYQLEIN